LSGCLIGLMHLFSLETKKVNFAPLTSLFLSPEDVRDAFCVAGGACGRPDHHAGKTRCRPIQQTDRPLSNVRMGEREKYI